MCIFTHIVNWEAYAFDNTLRTGAKATTNVKHAMDHRQNSALDHRHKIYAHQDEKLIFTGLNYNEIHSCTLGGTDRQIHFVILQQVHAPFNLGNVKVNILTRIMPILINQSEHYNSLNAISYQYLWKNMPDYLYKYIYSINIYSIIYIYIYIYIYTIWK